MSAEKIVAGVLFCLGLAVFGVLAWATQKAIALARPLDIGDVVVLGVFAIFGLFCVFTGWRLFRSAPKGDPAPVAKQGTDAPTPKGVRLSSGCAAVGVLFLVLSVLLPEQWYPVAFLFLGIALLAVSHALTPCVERMEQLRRARSSLRQL